MTAVWHGRDWQEYCVLLLQKRYAAQNSHSLQLVPDRHQGDLGIEAFSHDGFAYQCYAADEPCSVNELYEKQRNKLTEDLGKLRTKQADLTTLFGTIRIKRYVFMVHRHDSRKLIAHANAKAQEVLGWGLPFIASPFSIVIETDDDYAIERTAVHAIPQPLVGELDLTTQERATWATQNQGLRGTALAKLSRLDPSTATQERVLEALTGQYLQGENALDRLRTLVPEVHRGVLSAKAAQEELLVLEYPPEQNTTQAKLQEIAKDFTAKLRNDFPVLNAQLATTLAWSAVADWLMRCPLDFEGSDE